MMNTGLVAVAGLALSLSAPAFAKDMDVATMTCAELAAMDAAGLMHAVEIMEMAIAQMAGDTAMASDPAMLEETTMAVITNCEGTADMMARDELHKVRQEALQAHRLVKAARGLLRAADRVAASIVLTGC